jgi:hypothetical protein
LHLKLVLPSGLEPLYCANQAQGLALSYRSKSW